MRMVDRSPQDTQLAADRPRRPFPGPGIGSTGLSHDVTDGQALPERNEGIYSSRNPPRTVRQLPTLLGVVGEHVGHEDRRGITRAGGLGFGGDEFGEGNFSLLAICSARAALPAATAFSPDDVVTSAFFKPLEANS
jgi:hypothetical protein